MNNPLLTAAAWVIALALMVLVGISAYTAFFDEPEEVAAAETVERSWVEYEACLASLVLTQNLYTQGGSYAGAVPWLDPGECPDVLPGGGS